MTRTAAILSVAICAFFCAAFTALGTQSAHASTGAIPARSAACHEDQRCWNWATMGNHKRGVVTLWGNMLVVGPCRFQRLMLTGHIAYSITVGHHTYRHMLKRMRGDRTAMHRNCA